MDNDLRYHGNPMNWENVKGDLISRSALKEELEQYRFAVVGFEGVLFVIDNMPTVEYTFEEAFQKTVCEHKLYCPDKRQNGRDEACIHYLENISKMFEQGRENCAGDAQELQQKHIDALQYAIQRIKATNCLCKADMRGEE